jgi:DNA repair ATPase RecN
LRASNTARDLRQAGRELRDARQRLDAIVAAGDLVPRNTEGFAQRVTELSARVERIGPAIDAVALAQERVLADLAVRELQAQKRRLANYATQAQFALASLHDGASTAGGGR